MTVHKRGPAITPQIPPAIFDLPIEGGLSENLGVLTDAASNVFTPESAYLAIINVLYRTLPYKRQIEKQQAEIFTLQDEIAELKEKLHKLSDGD